MNATCGHPVTPPAPMANRGDWLLDPAVVYLNHGCFGARLRRVFDTQTAWREQFERQPLQLLERERGDLLENAKTTLGLRLGMGPSDVGFVTNATDGVNAVLRSLRFESGDVMLTTNHVYNAVRQTMRHLATHVGATWRELDVPYPVSSPGQVIEAIAGALDDRVKVLVIDHITSPTAVRFPVEAILEAARARGIDVLIDGAHAPGMIDLDVTALDAAYYTGNLHKWVCAPPGSAFLWVRPDRQAGIHPTVISHFYDEGFAAEFAWQGTRDISGWLSVPAAFETLDALGGGTWSSVMEHNHQLATWAQLELSRRWDVPTPTPADGSMLGSMVAMPVPPDAIAAAGTPERLHLCLLERSKIEVPVIEWNGRWLIRPSFQAYNTPADVEKLAHAVIDAAEHL
ncbi:MAG: aminotransferase class V-fold PLP-dependent enzyme [Phycisphaerales bacterium]|nr:aminotransferase class V-fold PLP-dependent enzyme [Phycisphaerae bacterium]NNF43951.1 aminotransferase class V-fold PLP-dependent enzyme [Phycisphaerales bacterium]NNM26870.1 aminotransferase class V-fold PLP-dependent enzyme [Phycisphaerales bacterium]